MARIADVFIRLLADAVGFRAQVAKEAQLAGDQAGKTLGARLADGISKSTGALGSALSKVGKGMVDTGRSLTTNLTLPIVAIGGASAKMALDFDTAMRRIQGLAKVPAAEIGTIRDQILQMGKDIGRDPQELAEAFYFVASAGFEASEAMEVLETSAKASAAGMGEVQSVAKVLGGVINAYGHDNITAARAGDILTAAIQDGAAEADDFAGSIALVVPNAAALSVSFDQVAAAMSAMTQSGTSAETAAVNLGQIFSALQKPTAQAEKQLALLGTSSAELRQELQEKGLLATLRDLQARFGDNEVAVGKVFGNIRALRGVVQLLNLDESQLNDIFGDTADALGTLDQAYQDTDGPQRQLDKSLAELKANAIEFGADVLPLIVDVMAKLADGASSLSEWWRRLDEGTQRLIVNLLAMAAVAGPLLLVFGNVAKGLGSILRVVGFLTSAKGIPNLISNLKSGRIGFLGWLGVIGLLGVALNNVKNDLNAFIDGIVMGKEAADDFHTILEAFGGDSPAARLFAGKLKDWGISAALFAEVMEKTGEDAAGAFDLIAQHGGNARAVLDEVATHLAEDARESARAAGLANQYIVEAAGRLPGEVGGAIEGGKGQVKSGADSASGEIPRSFKDAMQEAKDAAAALPSDIADAILAGKAELDPIRKLMRDIIAGSVTDSATLAQNAALLLSPMIAKGIQRNSRQATDQMSQVMEKILDSILAVNPKAFQAGAKIPKSLQRALKQDGPLAVEAMRILMGDMNASLAQLEKFARERGLDSIAALIHAMREKKREARAAGAEVAGAASDGLHSGNTFSAGRDLISSWVGGMEYQWYNVGAWSVQKIAANTRAILGGSLPTEGPLKGGLGSGGTSVGQSWIDALVQTLSAGLGSVASLLGGGLSSELAVAHAPYTTAGLNYHNARGIDGARPAAGGVNKNWYTTIQAPTKEKSVIAVSEEMRRAEYLGLYQERDDE